MSPRRQQFTLLHELGHHLQKTDIGLGRNVLAHRSPEEFEDAACDAFAARVLIPDDLLDHVTLRHGLVVATAAELFASSNASRAAIAVRLAARLGTSGVVAVLDEEGIVTFASARGGLYPPAKHSDQSSNPLFRSAVERRADGGTILRDDARIRYSTGSTSIALYGQARWAGDRLFVAMVEYGAPWLPFSPPRDGPAQVIIVDRWETCDSCGTKYEIRFTCSKCLRPRCPSGHCGCPDASERTCHQCFFVKSTSRFEGDSKICIDCQS